MFTRRDVYLYPAGALVCLTGVASCTNPPNIDVITTIEQLIQKIQAGVVAACAASGKWVPTVDTIIAVVSSLLGTGLNQANLAQALALVDQVVHVIAAQCPPNPPPTAGSGVKVVFY